jgi:ATP-binding cassette subfamily F protein 3
MAGPDAPPGLTDTYGEVQHRFEALGGYRLEAEAKIILDGLGFGADAIHRPLAEFSGGWRMRAALARLLLLRPDLLLLDEPTNHLDLESLAWLENFLAAYEGTVVIVSHDRYFLNRMVTAIADLGGGGVTLYHGDYDHFLVEREARQALLEAQARNQAKRVAEIERFIERFRYKASKARQVQSRVKMLDRMERIETEAAARRIHFSFPQPPRTGRLVARLTGVHKAYGDNVVYAGMDFQVERGDRVALVGVNGAGKSTLLKILAGALDFDAGERLLGSHVEVQYYAQHQLDALDPSRTVLEELEHAAPEAQISRLRTILGSFLFSGDAVEKKVAVLSGGEKARLALAKMLARPAALLCMDEPTNHLDLASKEVLEEALGNFTGTIVFISHDRYFINRIATQVVEVAHGHLTTHLGTYDDYHAHKSTPATPSTGAVSRSPADTGRAGTAGRLSADGGSAGAMSGPPQLKSLKKETADHTSRKSTDRGSAGSSAAGGSAGAMSGPPQPKSLKKETADTRSRAKALDREIKIIKQRLGAVEAQIQELEARQQEIGLALADPDLYRDGQKAREIAQSRKETEERVAWLLKEWEELSLRLSTVAGEGR